MPDISVSALNYAFPNGALGLKNLNLSLPAQSRTLLIGANGAGKSTLLRLLSGKHLTIHGKVLIGGADPFKDGLEGVTYLGLEWVLNPIVRTDIGVEELLDSVGGKVYRDRREQLVRILDIDEDWRMNMCSDGERRRVQLAMGLLRPWTVLLLDEVTVDLDVLARDRFLGFLKEETEARGCSIVYATHVMDGLAGWPTHLVRMVEGEARFVGSMEEVERSWGDKVTVQAGGGWKRNSGLLELSLAWLAEDYAEREKRGKRVKQMIIPEFDYALERESKKA